MPPSRPSAPARRAVDVVVERVIPCPVAVVASYAADPANAPHWYANIDTVRWVSPPPAAVGSRMSFEARFLGRRLAYTYEVVELVPGARLVMRTADGPFPMETTYTWASEAGGTRMALRNRGLPTGFARLGVPVVAAAMRRAMTGDLRRLEQVLTAQGGGHTT